MRTLWVRCDLAALGRRQQRTLLKILALHHGRPVGVDHLTECLWGNALPARASEQLSVLVSRLPALLGAERIERTDTGYKLTLDWLDLDARQPVVLLADDRHGSVLRGGALADAGGPARRGPGVCRRPSRARPCAVPRRRRSARTG